MFALVISRSVLIMDEIGTKSRSLGQILVKSCLHSRDHIFGPLFLRLGLNIYLDNISVRFDHGRDGVRIKVTRSDLSKMLFTL